MTEPFTQEKYFDWARNNLDQSLAAAHDIARVVAVRKNQYVLGNFDSTALAELSGSLLYSVDDGVELPTTGDWVYADFYDADNHAIIHRVLPRKSLLKRKTAGKRVEFQLIAANIDIAFIIQSVGRDFNLRRLERYLVMVNESGILPVILLSKSDSVDDALVAETMKKIAGIAPGVSVIACSSYSGAGIGAIRASLQAGLSYCLLGSSGVGKTSLLNCLLGEQQFATRELSDKHGKGRHTTTSRELIALENGALIVDTPGMRELGNISVDAGIDSTFADIAELASSCRFADCSHSNEQGCAVLAAVDAGSLPLARMKNYIKMKKESAFNEMSYAEKRKKDKDFGKMVNTIIKNKRR